MRRQIVTFERDCIRHTQSLIFPNNFTKPISKWIGKLYGLLSLHWFGDFRIMAGEWLSWCNDLFIICLRIFGNQMWCLCIKIQTWAIEHFVLTCSSFFFTHSHHMLHLNLILSALSRIFIVIHGSLFHYPNQTQTFCIGGVGGC